MGWSFLQRWRERKAGEKKDHVLFVLRETASFADLPELAGKEKLKSKLKSFFKKCRRVLNPPPGELIVGRIDPRAKASLFWFLYVFAAGGLRLKDYYDGFKSLGGHIRHALQVTDQLYWSRVPDGARSKMKTYSYGVLLGAALDYLYSNLVIGAVVRRFRPRLVIYPDGYYNKTFPSHYFDADYQIAPTQFTYRELIRQGVEDERIVRVTYDTTRAQANPSAVRNPVRLAVVYTGYWAYWSYPNQFRNLYDSSCRLIESLRAAFAGMSLTLKTHPNGASDEFVDGLKIDFKSGFLSGECGTNRKNGPPKAITGSRI